MPFSVWLLSLVAPLVKRVLVVLGIGVVTYAGVSTTIDALLENARASWAGAGFLAGVPQLVAMAGVNTALSILSGAIVGRVGFLVLRKFAVIA